MFFDRETEEFLSRMRTSRPLFGMMDIFSDDLSQPKIDDINEEKTWHYGYVLTVGSDGRPVVKEFGNVLPHGHFANDHNNCNDSGNCCGHDAATTTVATTTRTDTREPIVDTIVDKKVVKLIAEMPGVEKTDFKIVADEEVVTISAEHDGNKKYHARIPLKHKIEKNSAKATYRNGVLQLVFDLADEPQTGKTVEVE